MINNKSDNNKLNINRNIIFFVIVLSSFLSAFIGSALNIAIPTIGSDLNSSIIILSWIPTVYFLASAVFSVPLGRIADIYGTKKIFNYGLIIFTAATLFCAVSPSVLSLIVFRGIEGIGCAMLIVAGLAIITHIYPQNQRGKAIGINTSSVYIGLFMGPILGGFLINYLGWRSIFIVVFIGGLISIPLTLTKLNRDWKECAGEKFDVPGSLIYGISLTLLIYGLSIITHLEGLLIVVLGILGLIGFAMFELRTKNPVFEVRLFKNLTFGFSSVASIINYCASYAVIFLLSLYLQYIKGLGPVVAGMVLIAKPVMMAVTSPVGGKLSDRFSPGIIASIGMMITTLSLFSLTFLNSTTSIDYIIVILVIQGIGVSLFSSPNTNAIMSSVEKKFFGIASATVGTMRLMGQVLSMGIVIVIFSIFIGNVKIVPSNYAYLLTSINTIFIICTVLCFIGIFLSLVRVNPKFEG